MVKNEYIKRKKPISWQGFDWRGLGWRGLSWRGLSWRGLSWRGLGWRGLGWRGLGWRGLGWRVHKLYVAINTANESNHNYGLWIVNYELQ